MSEINNEAVLAIERWAGALINSDTVTAKCSRVENQSTVIIFRDGERVFSGAWFSIEFFDAMTDLIIAYMHHMDGSIDDKKRTFIDGFDVTTIMPMLAVELDKYVVGMSAPFKTKRSNQDCKIAIDNGFRLLRKTILTMRRELSECLVRTVSVAEMEKLKADAITAWGLFLDMDDDVMGSVNEEYKDERKLQTPLPWRDRICRRGSLRDSCTGGNVQAAGVAGVVDGVGGDR